MFKGKDKNRIIKHALLFLVIFTAGIVTGYGYAPSNHWWLSWVGLLVFGFIYQMQKEAKGAFLVTFVYLTTLHTFALRWIAHVLESFGEMPIILAFLVIAIGGMYLALIPSLLTWLIQRVVNKPVLRTIFFLPAVWSLSDIFNSWFLTGFPWDWLSYTQVNTYLTSYAPLIGAEGITLLLLISVMCAAVSFYKKSAIYVCLPLVIYMLGFALKNVEYTKPLDAYRVALLQGNIKTETKWRPENVVPILQTYYRLTSENLDTDIMVWPESAVPAFENDLERPDRDIYAISDLDTYMRENNIGLITGIQYYTEEPIRFYNSMLGLGVVNQENSIFYTRLGKNRYQKRHLVPIGEFVPFRSLLKQLGPIFNMPMNSFNFGEDNQDNITIKGLKVASAICYEIVFGNEMREQVKKDTNLIVTVSNDGWFNNTVGPYQHLQIARFRAMEFQKPILRATNNGITAIIANTGKIEETIPQNIEAVLKGKVVPTVGETPFRKYGRLPVYAYLTIFLIALVSLSYKKIMAKRKNTK